MGEEEVKARYAKEPWGRFLLSMGMEPYDTESMARTVAGEAAQRLENQIGAVICWDLARNVSDRCRTTGDLETYWECCMEAWKDGARDSFINTVKEFTDLDDYGEQCWDRLVDMQCKKEWKEWKE